MCPQELSPASPSPYPPSVCHLHNLVWISLPRSLSLRGLLGLLPLPSVTTVPCGALIYSLLQPCHWFMWSFSATQAGNGPWLGANLGFLLSIVSRLHLWPHSLSWPFGAVLGVL